MSNRTLDEYVASHGPHSRFRNVADDSGRDVDHRPTPGAFGNERNGFELDTAADVVGDGPAWMPGAIHHPLDALPRSDDGEVSSGVEASGARTSEPGERESREPQRSRASRPPASVEEPSTKLRAWLPLRFLRTTERVLWESMIVRRALCRVVEVQRDSADRIVRWLDSPDLFAG